MENTKECKKCGSNNLLKKNVGPVLLGFYILIASVYGTYQIIQDLINFFK